MVVYDEINLSGSSISQEIQYYNISDASYGSHFCTEKTFD